MPSELLNLTEIAVMVRRSAITISHWHQQGKMPRPQITSRGGTSCLWSRDEIESWIAGGCVPRAEWEARRKVGGRR